MIQAYLESKGGKSRELKNAHTGSIGVVASIERRKWLPDLLMVTIYFFNLIEKLILQTRKSNYQPLFVFQREKDEKEEEEKKLFVNFFNLIEELTLLTIKSNYQPLFVFQREKEEKEEEKKLFVNFFNLIEKLILQTRKSNYQPLFVFQGEKEEKEKLLTNYVNSKIVEFYLIKYFFLGQGMAFTIKYNNINPYPSPLKGD